MNNPGQGWTTFFQMAPTKTFAIPQHFHRISISKLCDEFKTKFKISRGVIVLEGGEQTSFYDTDGEPVFRQNSWFQYLFGIKEPGFYGAICLSTKTISIFIPRLPDEYRIWCGQIYPPEYFRQLYNVDEVFYVDELSTWISSTLTTEKEGKATCIYVLQGLNTDSGLQAKPATLPVDITQKFGPHVQSSVLHIALSTIRVTKSPLELSVMQYCAYVASNAHVQVMRAAKPGMMEYELEALFQYEIYRNGGCRHVAYTSICACGPNAAILHYGHAAAPNSRVIQDTDIALMDMGAVYHGYCSDITCSFPASGKFSEDQKIIYESVLSAQLVVMDAMKPGVSWPSCHLLAEREILIGLIKAGVLHNGTVDEMVEAELGAVFLPCGLGHLIGCDTHDVGGYLDGTPPRPKRDGLKKLRTARNLEEGMVLTVEPGCYFIDYLLDAALTNPLQAKYFNQEVLPRFRLFGGVRLEDDVAVTANGIENYTLCPRTIEEVETVMAGGQWPPLIDLEPRLRRRWVVLSKDCQSMVYNDITKSKVL